MEKEDEDGDQNDQEVTEETEETEETERDGVSQNHQINLLNSMKHSFIKPLNLLSDLSGFPNLMILSVADLGGPQGAIPPPPPKRWTLFFSLSNTNHW